MFVSRKKKSTKKTIKKVFYVIQMV